MPKIKIGLVDDHAILRKGIRAFLEEHAAFEVVAEGASGRDAIDMVRNHDLDVLLLDISMPVQSGLEALAMIRAKAPDVGILILSSHPEDQYAVKLIRQGASGYLNKQCESENIITAIRRVAGGHRYISSGVAELLAHKLNRPDAAAPQERLSDRELQVFIRLAKGDKVGDIGDALSLSAKTVSTYRTRVMEKMALTSNSDLTYYALKAKLIDKRLCHDSGAHALQKTMSASMSLVLS